MQQIRIINFLLVSGLIREKQLITGVILFASPLKCSGLENVEKSISLFWVVK